MLFLTDLFRMCSTTSSNLATLWAPISVKQIRQGHYSMCTFLKSVQRWKRGSLRWLEYLQDVKKTSASKFQRFQSRCDVLLGPLPPFLATENIKLFKSEWVLSTCSTAGLSRDWLSNSLLQWACFDFIKREENGVGLYSFSRRLVWWQRLVCWCFLLPLWYWPVRLSTWH